METGRLQTPRLSMLLRLAHALDVSDLAVLTGNGAAVPVEAFVGTAHSALDSVRTALTDYRVDDPTTPGGDVRHLALRLEHAWTVRHSSTHHRTAVGALLPALIRDAQRTVRSTAGEERRAARRVLAGVYQLTDFYVAYQPAPELVWLVADRALTEAQEADDPYLMAGGAWALTQALRDSGRWDEAVSVSEQAARRLEPWLQAHPTTGAVCGAHCCSTPGTSTRGAAGMGRRGPSGSAPTRPHGRSARTTDTCSRRSGRRSCTRTR